jgi:hypothetical protein
MISILCFVCAPKKKRAMMISRPLTSEKIRADKIKSPMYFRVLYIFTRSKNHIVRCAVPRSSYNSSVITNINAHTTPKGRPIIVENAISDAIGNPTNTITHTRKLFPGSLFAISTFFLTNRGANQRTSRPHKNRKKNFQIITSPINQANMLHASSFK